MAHQDRPDKTLLKHRSEKQRPERPDRAFLRRKREERFINQYKALFKKGTGVWVHGLD